MALMLGLSLLYIIVSPQIMASPTSTSTTTPPPTTSTTKTTTTTSPTTSTTTKTTTTTTTTTTASIDHYTVSNMTTPQAAGTTLSVTIQAQDNKNNNITTGSETIHISLGEKDSGATPVSVVTKNGTVTINMNLTTAQSGQQIVFTGDTSGKIGKSDIFTVIANPTIDHYTISSIAAQQTAGTGFNVTIQAQDTFGNNIATGSEAVKIELAKKDNGATPDTITTNAGTATFNMNMTAAQSGQQIICTGSTSGKTGTSNTFTVNPGTLAIITINPSNPTIDIMATQQFTATGRDSCNNEVQCTPVWAVVDTNAGSIDTAGLFTAGTKAGTFNNTIAATCRTVSGFASVTINQTIFALTVTQNANGTIAPSTTSVNYGSGQTFTITPATGYHITDVQVDGTSVGAISSYSFTNVTMTHNISAIFAINTYTVIFTAGAHGTISSGTAIQTINYGGNATAPTITANPGWTFTGWDTAFTNVTTNLSVTAQYSQITYTVTFTAGTHGIINSGTAVQMINYGGNATAPTTTANPGWTFTGWDTAFTNVTTNLTVTAQYSQITYTVTFTSGTHGIINSGTAVQTINYGGNATAPTITANPGWTFTGWDTAFTNVTSNLTVTAQYNINTYTITFNAGAHGIINSGTAVQTINYGGNAVAPTLTINPGWFFNSWDKSFTNVTSNFTVNALFIPEIEVVTFAPGMHGALLNGNTIQPLNYNGTAVAPIVTANPGWTFTGWDKPLTNINSYTLITAEYSQTQYTVTFVAGEHGNPEKGNMLQTVTSGADAAAPSIAAEPGWIFTGWDRAFNNVTGDLTVTARYQQAVYTVTFDPGSHGTVTDGFAKQFIAYGQDAIAPTVTAEPDWIFTGWDTTFADATTDLTVKAQYELVTTVQTIPPVMLDASLNATENQLLPDTKAQPLITATPMDVTNTTATDVKIQTGLIAGKPSFSLIAGIIVCSACFCLIITLFILRFRSKQKG